MVNCYMSRLNADVHETQFPITYYPLPTPIIQNRFSYSKIARVSPVISVAARTRNWSLSR